MGGASLKLSVILAGVCTISKHVGAQQLHLIILYTPDGSLVGGNQ